MVKIGDRIMKIGMKKCAIVIQKNNPNRVSLLIPRGKGYIRGTWKLDDIKRCK